MFAPASGPLLERGLTSTSNCVTLDGRRKERVIREFRSQLTSGFIRPGLSCTLWDMDNGWFPAVPRPWLPPHVGLSLSGAWLPPCCQTCWMDVEERISHEVKIVFHKLDDDLHEAPVSCNEAESIRY